MKKVASRTIPAKGAYWVIATGYGPDDIVGYGDGDCDLPAEIDEKYIVWFYSEHLALQHPAMVAYKRREELQLALTKAEQLKSDQAYVAKSFDAFRWKQAYPTEEASNAATFNPDEYKDLAIEVEERGITPWQAATAVLDAVQVNQRDIERTRVRETLKLKEALSNE